MDGVACRSRTWTNQEKDNRGMGTFSRKSEELISVQMNISQAPLSFRQPVTQKKAFYPPFKIQLSVKFGKEGSSIPMKVNAYSLTEDGLVSFLKQVSLSSFPALPLDNGLQNCCICHAIENRESNNDHSSSTVTETFEFVDMYFKSSSRMGLRWLLFAAQVEGDLLCTLYRYPTIVLSRKTDQYSKACCLLAKSSPVMEVTDRSSASCTRTTPPSSFSQEKALVSVQKTSIPMDTREWILAAYGECRFSRRINQADLSYLEASLGLSKRVKQNVPDVSTRSEMNEDQTRFESFAKWYVSCLLSLKKEHEMWCSVDVTRICPFSVDRDFAETILLDQTTGTFLVRISSEPGCFTISVKEETTQGDYVDHYLIDALDLTYQSLSDWVLQNQRAHIFFDVNTRATFPKHRVFIKRVQYNSSLNI
eukprot:g3921.t2